MFPSSDSPKRPIVLWLYVVAFFILGMVVLGGLTRLTGSGLSMVEWKVVMGAVPPLNESDWMEVFDKYKQFPQYKLHNHGMNLDEFKFIFYMEYFHRLLGRLVGMVFFFPMAFFWLRGALDRKWKIRLVVLLCLGGLQGVVGWIMVKSGLVDVPHVSHFRLAIHFSLALLTFSICLWYAWTLTYGSDADAPSPPLKWGRVLPAALGLQIVYGAFVAGLKAGYAYNTYPKMYDEWLPSTVWDDTPLWLNLFENPAMVQFIHRHLGVIIGLAILVFWFLKGRRYESLRMRRGSLVVAVLVVLQVTLGILTLVLLMPISLASLHQVTGVFLFSGVLFLCHPAVRGSERF